MELKTAAAVIHAIGDMESDAADFYARCAASFPEDKNWLMSLAEENRKFGRRVQKAYYSAVTDALETNFSFNGLEQNVQLPETGDPSSLAELVKTAVELENRIQLFYRRAADQSRGWLDGVSRVMTRIAATRDKRKEDLQARL